MCRKPLFVLLTAAMLAVIPQIIHAGWMRTFGGGEDDEGCFVQELEDGSFIVLGETKSFGAGETDIWLLKVSADGDTTWTRTYGGDDSESACCVLKTEEEGYIILGSTSSVDSGGVWLIRTYPLGDITWSRTYGGSCYFSCFLKKCSNKSYTLIDSDRFMKINTAGDVTLSKTYEEYWGEYYKIDCANSTSDGGFILFSWQGFPNSFVKVHEDGEVVRVLPEFNPQVNGMNYISEGHQGYLYIGPGWGAGSDFDLRAAEADSTIGYDLWFIEWGWPVTHEDGYCIKPTADGGYIIAGDPWTLLKLKGQGYGIWSHEYGGVPRYVEQTSDGGYIVVGEKDGDLFLVKTDSLGNLGIKEETVINPPLSFEVVVSIGPQIVLSYENYPQGFHASIFDATGRKVDELHATGASGTITWGETQTPGVYFIRSTSGTAAVRKVILVE